MKAKIVPPDKMHLVEEFHAAQKVERELAAELEKIKAAGGAVSEDLLERGIEAGRRTVAALTAIQGLP